MKFKNITITKHNETVRDGESCGLAYTGEYEDGTPQFIGDNRAWAKFNSGEFGNEFNNEF